MCSWTTIALPLRLDRRQTSATTNSSERFYFECGCFGINGLAARASVGWFHTDSSSAADEYTHPSSADEYANTSAGKTA